MGKARDTLGDKSQRQISATSRSVCTASKQVAATRQLFGAHAANLEEGECKLVFQQPISELPFASVSRRVYVRNHSNENEFDLHENGPVGETHFHLFGFARRLVLKWRQMVTRKWPSIQSMTLSLVNLYFVAARTCPRRVQTLRQRCFAHFVAAISRTNSNLFEFVRLIAATKFCRGDKDCRYNVSCQKRQHVAATCPRDMLQRLVAQCVPT